jgi:hypothetical protein
MNPTSLSSVAAPAPTLTEAFDDHRRESSDIQQHLDGLSDLAAQCRHVTEFGVRTGNSTVALLAGLAAHEQPAKLISYDINPHQIPRVPVIPPQLTWDFRRADTSQVEIEPTDLLFIDSRHTNQQLAAELKQAPRVRHFLAFHDTVTFGSRGEDGLLGLSAALWAFLSTEEGRHWTVRSHNPENNGFLVLSRR